MYACFSDFVHVFSFKTFHESFNVEEFYEVDDEEEPSYNETHEDHHRKKRGWTHSSCSQWGHSTYYNIIQSSGEFNTDKSRYSRRRHCLAYKYIGVSKANAKMYGGIFAGKRGTSNDYKLFTKLVGKAKIFSKTFDIGTILSYRVKQGGSITQKNYVVFVGKSFKNSDRACTTKTWAYQHSFYIPIYKIDIWVASINLGAQIRPRFELNFVCQQSGSNTVTRLKPKAILRIAASAQASLAVSIKH